MTPRWMTILYSVLLIGASADAHAGRLDSVRDLAGRVGPIIGSASACPISPVPELSPSLTNSTP